MLLKKDTENVHGQSKGTQDIAEQPEITWPVNEMAKWEITQ
jgi:hypothetical protein